jgi:ParB family chromosome partitioning protein
MAKRDDLKRMMGENVAESMGAGREKYADAYHSGAGQGVSMPTHLQGLVRRRDVSDIPVDRIERDPNQPREEFEQESLERLAASFKTRGQLQPIRVRWDPEKNLYILIAGERRWRAAKLAGMAAITAMIQEVPTEPAELLAIQLIENAQREDLKPVEQARAYKRLMDQYGWTATRVGEELAIAQATVSRALKLLELPESVQQQVEQGILPPDSAYEVSKLDRPTDQVEIAERIVAEKLSRDDLRNLVKEKKTQQGEAVATRRTRVEYRLDGGNTIVVSGPAVAAGSEAIRAVLLHVLERLDGEANRGQAA